MALPKPTATYIVGRLVEVETDVAKLMLLLLLLLLLLSPQVWWRRTPSSSLLSPSVERVARRNLSATLAKRDPSNQSKSGNTNDTRGRVQVQAPDAARPAAALARSGVPNITIRPRGMGAR